MNKAELISAISKQMAVSKKEAGSFIQTLNEIACSEIKNNNCFVIPGLAKISKVHRRARTGRNPSTGEKIKINARTALKFKPAKALHDATMNPRGSSPVIGEVKLSKPGLETLNIKDSVVWLEGWFESKEDFPWKVLKTCQDPLEKIVVIYKKKAIVCALAAFHNGIVKKYIRNGQWDGGCVETIPDPETKDYLKRVLSRCKQKYQAVL